ncbi:MAG TPA: hypothetical protein DCZ01_09290 [Elusimicrobia bacterium]|nr:MAG: hypothetical protein A2X37_07620 [Elusimicrobia bacterium GWA2_66_18]HAZ08694.1 hypothetical protein [Elusimicrobiota bacterium]
MSKAKNILAGKRLVAAALCAALCLSSLGPQAAAAAAQEAAAGRAARLPSAPVALPSSAALPCLSGLLAPTPLALPALSAAPPLSVLPTATPSPRLAVDSPAPAAAAALGHFDERVARPLADPGADPAVHLDRVYDLAAPAGPVDAAVAAARAEESASSLADAAVAAEPSAAPPIASALAARAERRNRSALFPVALASVFGLGWLTVKAVEYGLSSSAAHQALAEPSAAAVVLGMAAIGLIALTGVFLLNALVDAAAYGAATWRGRKVTNEDFRAFVRREVMEGRLEANAATLLKPYRPKGRRPDFTFAFAAHGSIWMRPELIATPVLFRMILVHELHHWKAVSARGPPARGVRGLLSGWLSEIRARGAEFQGPSALKEAKVSVLERALRQVQVSLRREAPYRILVLNPDSAELDNPGLYEGLSGGSAKVTSLRDAEPISALGSAQDQGYQAVVMGRASSLLPPSRSTDALRLETALKQLDSLFVLATRLVPRGAQVFAGTSEERAFSELSGQASRLRAAGSSPQALKAFERDVRRLWRRIADAKLKGMGAARFVDKLYASLGDRGTAFLSFAPEDPGVVTWERLLRYWEASDGGQFRVMRVDLESGGHIVILRKIEARVGLWLRPLRGGRIEDSVPRACDSAQGRAAARRSMEAAGFSDQLALFDKLDVRVRHIFGADVGRQEIYVSVPRRNAAAIRRFVVVESGSVESSRTGFETHLVESAGIQAVPPVWRIGVTGSGGKIMWVDTGADASHEDFAGRLDVIDMVNEGPEDWSGHGTHVAGISISGRAPYLGMAKGALGTMAKVFSRDQAGASDGEIMGSAAIALQKGYDVVSLSLGIRGASSDHLAEFFSQLTHQKNSAGEYLIVSASAGNAGPFDRTLSQPSVGADVLSVAAAAKSLDDGRPEIAFYSSVGPDIDRRFSIKRLRLKPEITGIGGDVVTEPGSSNVYKYGVYSAKSKDSGRSASDQEDGRHTGLSGSSMSNPAAAVISLLVKLAMKAAGVITPFVAENLPFAVKAVLMRASKDLGVPVWFQGSGLVDAWAAVKLVCAAAGRELGSRLKRFLSSTSASAEGWGWLERLKAVADAEDRVFREAEIAKSQAQSRFEQGPESAEDPEVPPESRVALGNAIQSETVTRFNEARDREAPALAAALKDPVWLVRLRAAFVLMNFRAPGAVMALAEAALSDEDSRVRQMAFLALAETPTHAVDVLLQRAVGDERWDVGVYAAYALARRGDRSGIVRLVQELANPDKSARYTAAWLAGQLGVQASAAEAEALSARVGDRNERGNIRHLAAAALTNLADVAPEAVSDRVVTDLLSSAGPENLALTRTLAKFFPVAARDRAFVARLRREPLKPIVTDWVLRNKEALQKPGALAELVQLLARAASIPLDAPTQGMDLSGAGVLGVDALIGPLDLLVTPPSGLEPAAFASDAEPEALRRALAAAGLESGFLKRYEAAGRAAMPLSGAFWLSVPEHKLYALTLELQHRGYGVRLALPEYPLARGAADAEGYALDLGEGETQPLIASEDDLSLVRVRAAGGVSEARVMAALEQVAGRIAGRGPTVVSLSVAAPTGRRTPLSVLVDKLVLAGVGVVVGAGNRGPAQDTVSSPGDSKLAVVVAAASREKGLQFYSSRGTPNSPRITWTDLVPQLDAAGPLAAAAAAAALLLTGQAADAGAPAAPAQGTAAAAESTARKLAALARVLQAAFMAAGLPLPRGWFSFLQGVVAQTLTPLRGHGAHEVGAGLFDDEGKARAALEERLKDLPAVAREAEELDARARFLTAPALPLPGRAKVDKIFPYSFP